VTGPRASYLMASEPHSGPVGARLSHNESTSAPEPRKALQSQGFRSAERGFEDPFWPRQQPIPRSDREMRTVSDRMGPPAGVNCPATPHARAVKATRIFGRCGSTVAFRPRRPAPAAPAAPAARLASHPAVAS